MTPNLDDAEELVDVVLAGEEDAVVEHLGEDDAYCPHVDPRAVALGTVKQLWRPVPPASGGGQCGGEQTRQVGRRRGARALKTDLVQTWWL